MNVISPTLTTVSANDSAHLKLAFSRCQRVNSHRSDIRKSLQTVDGMDQNKEFRLQKIKAAWELCSSAVISATLAMLAAALGILSGTDVAFFLSGSALTYAVAIHRILVWYPLADRNR